MSDEDSKRADELYDYLEVVLSAYGNKISNIVTISGNIEKK